MRALSLVILLAACGGNGSSGGTPLEPSEAQAACQDTCAHALTCGWITDSSACAADCTTQSTLFRGDGYTAWLECSNAAACGGGNPGEACYLQAVGETPPRGVHEDYVSRCTAAQGTCTLPAGVCGIEQVQLFSDAYMTGQVLPCFDMACSALVTCVETYVLDAF